MSSPDISPNVGSSEEIVSFDCAWEKPDLFETIGLFKSNSDLDPHTEPASRFETCKRAGIVALEIGVACGAVAVELIALKAKNAARRIIVGTEK